jgi:hypothetical protein
VVLGDGTGTDPRFFTCTSGKRTAMRGRVVPFSVILGFSVPEVAGSVKDTAELVEGASRKT